MIVPTRRAANGAKVLALPKGHPDGERDAGGGGRCARCARRRACTRTSSSALGDVRYWYQRDGRRIVKVVAFFLLGHDRGDPATHDDQEIDEARWMALEEAARELTHAGEREMAARALSRLAAGR